MKKTTLFFVTILLSGFIYSQSNVIQINSLELGQLYTDAQIRASLGNPSNVKIPNINDDISDLTEYHYNQCRFVFQKGELVAFHLKDTTYKVDNFLTVDMDVSTLTQIGGLLIYYSSASAYYWAPSQNYFDNIGYLAIHIHPVTNKIVLITGRIATPLL
ncbi:MAG TPA: hypothetical protein P5523_05450 [Bacteroidales bacterium]|nr:hypothetical protein [Bacteroidales bacterium]